ncbi:MAG: MarR family winged helix-turn-helix transcriptional regulator [Oscillospiraceae bacterium]
MNDFETNLNNMLVDTFNYILKYEEMSLKTISSVPVTVTEVHMIEAINKMGGKVTVSEIASVMNIAVPTATVAVKKLESKGFVTKVPCIDDGRRTIISLTPFGQRIDKAHGIFHRKMVRNISSGFLDSEKDILLTAVNKLSKFFKEKVEA